MVIFRNSNSTIRSSEVFRTTARLEGQFTKWYSRLFQTKVWSWVGIC